VGKIRAKVTRHSAEGEIKAKNEVILVLIVFVIVGFIVMGLR
jgi:hypothetical protein